MSLSDLRKLDLLRPETQWSGRVPRANVNVPLAVVSAAMGIGGCVAMGFGDGGVVTWLGLGSFCVSLAIFMAVNLLAIGRRRAADDPEDSAQEAAKD